jgi:hypothetical protein
MLTSHFWIIGLLVMYVNLGIGRVKMRTLVAEGRLSDFEANRFCIYAALAFAALFGAFEMFSFASGIPPQCQMLLPMTDRAAWPIYLLTLLSGIALLYWVWRRGGDRTLALVGPAFTRGPTSGKKYTPAQVRVALTGLIVVAWGGTS